MLKKALGRSGRLEPLQLALASAHHLRVKWTYSQIACWMTRLGSDGAIAERGHTDMLAD